MAVKAIRIFLAAVVLIMSVANVLFIVENWNMAHTEAAGRSWPLEIGESKGTVLSKALETSSSAVAGGMYQFSLFLGMCLNRTFVNLLLSTRAAEGFGSSSCFKTVKPTLSSTE